MRISRRDSFIAFLATSFTLPLVVAAQDQAPRRLPSSVFSWEKLEVKPTRNGARRDLFDSATATLDRLECHVTTVNAGETPHAPHRHADEELVIAKEGTVEVTINGQTQQGSAGSLFFFASNDLHGLRNAGDTPATYHVLRWTSPGKDGPRPR